MAWVIPRLESGLSKLPLGSYVKTPKSRSLSPENSATLCNECTTGKKNSAEAIGSHHICNFQGRGQLNFPVQKDDCFWHNFFMESFSIGTQTQEGEADAMCIGSRAETVQPLVKRIMGSFLFLFLFVLCVWVSTSSGAPYRTLTQ